MVIRRCLHLGAFALLVSGWGCDKTSPAAVQPTPATSLPASTPEDAPPVDAVDTDPPFPAANPAADPAAAADPSCGDETCTPPATCVEYYGIAGASGPKFQSCEVRCKGDDDASCPEGTRCVTVADGPGQVCR